MAVVDWGIEFKKKKHEMLALMVHDLCEKEVVINHCQRINALKNIVKACHENKASGRHEPLVSCHSYTSYDNFIYTT